MSNELRKNTVKSLAIVGSSQVVIKIISFLTTIVLARILTPEDYGVMALASLVIGLVEFFNEMGMSAAVIQRQNATKKELSGVFYLALILGIVCWGFVAIFGVWAAEFFDSYKLATIIPILGIGLVLGSVKAVPLGLMRKDLRFKELSVIGIISVIINTCVTLLLAINGFGVWSLVYGSLVSGTIATFLQLKYSKWVPGSICGIKDALPIFFYGTNITASRIVWYIYSNADKAIIGKLLGEKLLGIYTMSFTLASLPSSHITSIVVNVSSPVFSKLQGDRDGLKSSIISFIQGIAHLTFPALAGIGVVAPELVIIVIGEKWVDVILPLQILCVLGVWKSIDPVLTQALISTGHATQVIKYTGLCSVLIPTAIFFGSLFYGIHGAAYAWVLMYPFVSLYLFSLCKLKLGISGVDVFKSIMPVLRNSAVMLLTVYLARLLLLSESTALPVVLVCEVVLGVLVYLLTLSFDKRSLSHLRILLLDLGLKSNQLGFWPINKVR